MFAIVSLFLPYILSILVLGFLSIYIIANKYTRQLIFIHKGSRLLKLFFAYILTVPLLYKNWLGLFVGIAMILALCLGLFMRSIMTKELYERLLTLVCIMSVSSAGYAIIERLVNIIFDGRHSQRIASVFSHPNYFGTMVGTVIIICAYKILTNQEHKWLYYTIAGINVISIYLCKSMFVWMEVFLGVSVLLIVLNKRKLLAIWFTAAALGAFLVFGLEWSIIPRLSDMSVTVGIRQQIWRQAFAEILRNPLFGHGFMSFSFVYDSYFQNNMIPHSHSIYLDMLLNFGIVGTSLFAWYIFKYYVSLIRERLLEKKVMINALILAVVVAALVHGATDLTLLWIQTFPLFLLIVAGLGADEKNGRNHVSVDVDML